MAGTEDRAPGGSRRRGAWIACAAWLACMAGPAPVHGVGRVPEVLPPCPFPGSGIIHLYGEVESVTVVRNRVKHGGVPYRSLPRNREFWDEKHVLSLRIDSGRGREELDAPLVRYPEGYGKPGSGLLMAPPGSEDLVGRKGLFRFERWRGELVLERIWSWKELGRNHKVCRDLPSLDSLEVE